ncbi:LCP family protein [Catenuloplanes atrovinosus]|uniref:Anionic cell wall polymer biosynthesis LytR-Cps2A-Psr (LCP) family protein n=1 Tax=Catenuloplanes atrovinosus TaxID=137266 RepID=A0AAE4C7A0_9ACTN|nr:LCP family protein [Catenuloplanes atrovinosus]MDR7273628.1 anionic cell wall polymer biosynthesis LytR-Cps2A-Psr (LCP) family protein [Catenuloplanes atrovinosus]
MTSKRRRRRDPLWARLLLIFGAVLAVSSGGTLVAARTLVDKATDSITQTELIGGGTGAAAAPEGNNIDGAVNMLLVGIDARENDTDYRADTIIILHIPETHDQAYLISIPRDWMVDIPPHDELGFPGTTAKINSAFFEGSKFPGSPLEKRGRGTEVLAATLTRNTGIEFNGAAVIDFGGFHSIVHALGGVDLCITERAESVHIGVDPDGKLVKGWYNDQVYPPRMEGLPPGSKPLVHEPGCRAMDATRALDYARIRKDLDNGDYGRQQHQQQLIKAIVKKATSSGVLTDLGKLNELVKAAGEAFILDTRGTPVADFFFTLKGVAANDLTLIKTNAGAFNSAQTASGEAYEALDALSLEMLKAADEGTLSTFLIENPQFIANSR